ncbi:MAG: DoxX family protein [Armatimonadetes bacterium]|nr:DoxX family protein [Armatimonadota bacterium]
MNFLQKITATDAPAAIILIRLMIGGVFLSEGIQKFLFPESIGAGRFAQIGIPSPELMGPLVGVFEMGCGAFILIGLLTRLAAIPLIVIMLAAISITKIPLLLQSGFWKMAHDSRTDYAMLLGSILLLIVGAGRWSVDRRLMSKLRSR